MIVVADRDFERLDVFIAEKLSISRNQASQLIKGDHVTDYTDKRLKVAMKVAKDDKFFVELPTPPNIDVLEPADVAFEVIYEDEYLLVINKPSGLVVHPAPDVTDPTLVNGLLYRYPEMRFLSQRTRPGIVHRLDGGTSGLMIISRKDSVTRIFQQMFQARTINKQYIALVNGKPKQLEGVISAPLGRDPDNPLKQCIIEGGRPSLTGYKVLWTRKRKYDSSKYVSMVLCKLFTGRTHQIRVHLAGLNCPLIGDVTYGAEDEGLSRVYLHSWHLEFNHPVTNKKMVFTQYIPKEFIEYLGRYIININSKYLNTFNFKRRKKFMNLKDYEFWFVVGSQFLYGTEVLETVASRAQEMADKLNASGNLPCKVIYKVTAKTNDEIANVIRDANHDEKCAGIITWCHTFSPSKMWINGLANLQKPWCHFATQYNREIPNEEIDMDFMNLNQAAHGDREHGFIGARLRAARKIIAGYWQDEDVQKRLGKWQRAAVGAAFSRSLKVMRFGDNMREVAVTEGDKVEVQIKLGWQVNTWPVGKLVEIMNEVTGEEVDALMKEYESLYEIATDDLESVRYQAREEIAIKKMLDYEGCKAFSNTFQDLYGMKQLPGLASQHLMHTGYGFGAEGDWKVSAMTAIIKFMTQGQNGGSAFMEDYTYHLVEGNEYSLGAHMLEVCPSVAAEKPKIEVHHLGIGDKEPPARLVFEGHAGKAVVVSLVDMGGRLRLICQDIECVKPIMPMPNLPVARVMWKAAPDLKTGLECWITAGGAHHSVLSYDVDAEQMKDWARIMGIEFVHIDKDTTVEKLEHDLFLSDIAWKLN